MRMAMAYLRVSSKGQREGNGFDRQAEVITTFAKKAGYKIIGFYRDVHTGTADAFDRPEFARMMAETNGVRAVIIERLDRLARAVIVQEQTITWLAAHDIELLVADTGENITQAYREDPMKKCVVQIVGVLAELEKSMLVRKLKVAREKVRAEKGKCEGVKAFGEIDLEERAAVERIYELRKRTEKGYMGYRTIAKVLNEEGHKTRSGRPWHFSSVRSIIKGKVYAEIREDKKGE